MSQAALKPTPEAVMKARAAVDLLARLLREDAPDGDELKTQWYEVGLTIRPALAAIREMEGQAQLRHTAPNEFLGVG